MKVLVLHYCLPVSFKVLQSLPVASSNLEPQYLCRELLIYVINIRHPKLTIHVKEIITTQHKQAGIQLTVENVALNLVHLQTLKKLIKKKKLNDRLLVQIPNVRVILIQLLLNFVRHLQLLLKKNMKIYLLVQIPNDRSYSMMSILIFLVKTSVRALMGGGDVVAEHIITTVLSQRNGVFGTSQ